MIISASEQNNNLWDELQDKEPEVTKLHLFLKIVQPTVLFYFDQGVQVSSLSPIVCACAILKDRYLSAFDKMLPVDDNALPM